MSDPRPHIVLVGGAGIAAGVPHHICDLAQTLSTRARVTVLSDHDEGGFARLADLDVEHQICPHLTTRLRPAHLFHAAVGLQRMLKELDADIIWLHARLPVLLARVLMAAGLWRPKAKVICSYHGLPFDPGHSPWARRASLLMEKVLLSWLHGLHLVTLSADMQTRLMNALGPRRAERHSFHILENASSLRPLPRPQKSPHRHLVMTGRNAWQKNLPLAAQLLAYLPPDVHLTYCGAGTDDPAFCDEIAATLPSEMLHRVHFEGPQQDVRPFIAKADAVLLTSRYEGVPIGALEAMEAGKPLILSHFDGARELATAHPYVLTLDFTDLQRDAMRVDQLLTTVSAHGPRAARDIRRAWAQRWSPAQFDPAVHALMDEIQAYHHPSTLAAE